MSVYNTIDSLLNVFWFSMGHLDLDMLNFDIWSITIYFPCRIQNPLTSFEVLIRMVNWHNLFSFMRNLKISLASNLVVIVVRILHDLLCFFITSPVLSQLLVQEISLKMLKWTSNENKHSSGLLNTKKELL